MNLRWIWVILLVGLAISLIWRNEFSGIADPSWTKCKESLLEQIFTSKCTLRFEEEITNPACIYSAMAHSKSKHSQKMVKKGNLPSKICIVCEKPFNWRKKWAKDWDQVKYCSERCRRS